MLANTLRLTPIITPSVHLHYRVEITSTYEWDERPTSHVDFSAQFPDCQPYDFLDWPDDAQQAAELAAILCSTEPTNGGPSPQFTQGTLPAPVLGSTHSDTGLVEEGPTYTVLSPSPASQSSSSTSAPARPVKKPRRRGSSHQSSSTNDLGWYNRDLVFTCRVTLWHAIAIALAIAGVGALHTSVSPRCFASWYTSPALGRPLPPLCHSLRQTSELLNSYINAALPRFPQAGGSLRGGRPNWFTRIVTRQNGPAPPPLPPKPPKSPPNTRGGAHDKQEAFADSDMSPPRTTRRNTGTPVSQSPPLPPRKWNYQPMPPYTQTPYGYQPQGLADATRPPVPWYRKFFRGLGYSTQRVTEQSISSAAGTTPMLAFAAALPPQQPAAPTPLPPPTAPPPSPLPSPDLQRPRTDSGLPAYYPPLPRSDHDTVDFNHNRLHQDRPQMPRGDPDGDIDAISVDSNNIPQPQVHPALRNGVFVADRFDRYGPAFNLATIPEDTASRTHCLARASLCQRLTGYLTLTVATGAGATALAVALHEHFDDPEGLEKWTDESIESFVQTYGVSSERVLSIIKRVDLDTYRTAELLVSAWRQATTINKQFGRPLTFQLTPPKNDSLLSPVHQVMLALSTDFDAFMTYLVDTSQFAESVGRVKRSIDNHRRRRFTCGDAFSENDSLAWAECMNDLAKKTVPPPPPNDTVDEVVNPYSPSAKGTLQNLFTTTPLPETTPMTDPPVDCDSLLAVAQEEHSADLNRVNEDLDECNSELQQVVTLAAENAKTTNDTLVTLRSALKATSASRDYHRNSAEEYRNKARTAESNHDSTAKRLLRCNSANVNLNYKFKASTIAHRDAQVAAHVHMDKANTCNIRLDTCESHLSECTSDNRNHRARHATCTDDLETSNRLLVNAGNTLRQLAEAPDPVPQTCLTQLIPGIPNAIVRLTWFCFLGAIGGLLAALLFATLFICRSRCRGYQPQVNLPPPPPGLLNNAHFGFQPHPPAYGEVPPPEDGAPPAHNASADSQHGSPDGGSLDHLVLDPLQQRAAAYRQPPDQ